MSASLVRGDAYECIVCGAPGRYRYCSTACEAADAPEPCDAYECLLCGAPGGYRYCSTACEIADNPDEYEEI
ncbi:hypothetical protein [Streptomyces laurentii]|uniref:hypothetical protein n=1 Tax=Streptomyces laurentii TaxID=39478 RepID=UPI0036872D66